MTFQSSRPAFRPPGWIVLVFALLTLRAGSLLAHQMPFTAAMLDFHPDAVAVELMLPLQELQLSFGQPLLDAPADVVPKHGPALKDYIAAHIHPTARTGGHGAWKSPICRSSSTRCRSI